MHEKQIEKLYDYTKFHIGLYTGLIAAVTAVLSLEKAEKAPLDCRMIPFLGLTLLFLVVAGVAGGVIGSTISLASNEILSGKKIGPPLS